MSSSPFPARLAILCLLVPSLAGAQVEGSGIDRRAFKRPIRLRTDDEVIDVTNGHAAPAFVDLDGDGLRDLLVGEFGDQPYAGPTPDGEALAALSGRLRVYKNRGDHERARFKTFNYLQAGDGPAAVPAECCIGFTPRLADLQNDGIADLLSGSDVGSIFLFRGLGRGRFASAVELVGPQGEPFVRDLSVTVDTGDLDGDGDLDLVLATSESAIYVVENQGTPEEPKYADRKWRLVSDEGRSLWGSDARVADWDGDGRLDLVVGTDHGGVAWYPNTGEGAQTVYGRREWILHETPDASLQDEGSVPRRPGARAKVDVADYDGDGRADLFVGDYAIQLRTSANLSAAQTAEYKSLRRQLTSSTASYSRLLTQWRKNPPPLPLPLPPRRPRPQKDPNPNEGLPWDPPKPVPPPEKMPVVEPPPGLRPGAQEMGKLTAEVEGARLEVERLSGELRTLLPKEPMAHGWVWVFRRKE